jgi:hypothetical protein
MGEEKRPSGFDERDVIPTLAAMVRREFPHLTIIARAHDRNHAHRLMDLGITEIVRETYFFGWLRLSELALDRTADGDDVSRPRREAAGGNPCLCRC